jgi:acyl-coenzyme A thioesterase PaaI-like protein
MKDKLREVFTDRLGTPLAATAFLRGFGLWKVPLLFSVGPKVRELTDEATVVEIPLRRWTRNHLGSMYFGTLAIGADCVVGLTGWNQVRKRGGKVHLSFKDFHADFLKRPEGNVLFHCREGRKVAMFVEEVLRTGERGNLAVQAYATVKGSEEPVARFTLTLSLKRKL